MKLNEMIKAKQNKIAELNNTIKNENSSVDEVRSAVRELEVVTVELVDLQDTLAEVEARDAKPAGVANVLATSVEKREDIVEDEFNTIEYRNAFKNYVMTGKVDEVLTRANAKTKQADVGTVIPTVVMNQIIEKSENIGHILALVTKTNVPAGISYPTSMFGQIKATWVAEGEGSDKQKKTTGNITFTNFKLRAEVAVTLEVDTMSLAAFESKLVKNITDAIVKAKEEAIFNGNGTTQPKGLINYVDSLEADQKVTVSKIGYDTIVNMEAAVADEYEDTAKIFMAKKTFYAFQGITDQNGQPIARVSAGINGAPTHYLFGREVVFTSTYLPTFASAEAGAVFGYIADLSDYVLNSIYNIGITKRQNWDTEDIETKAVTSCDGKLVTTDGLVALIKG